MSTNKLLPAWRAPSLAWPSLCLTFLVQRTKTIIVEKVAAASVVARKIIIVENCSNSLYPSQPDGACFEIAGRWSDAALCGCGRVGALTCPERASVVRAANSAERSARPVSGHLLLAPPNVWKYLEETCWCTAGCAVSLGEKELNKTLHELLHPCDSSPSGSGLATLFQQRAPFRIH